MNFVRFSLILFVVQVLFSLAMLLTSLFNSNSYAMYHTISISIFMLLTGLLGVYFSFKNQLSRIIANAWLIISIVTAYLSIQISPFFDNPFKPVELTLVSITTLFWVIDLYLAYRNKIPVLKI
jgi:peptidoglycan/LPS O-acetylase OafA/YrhL